MAFKPCYVGYRSSSGWGGGAFKPESLTVEEAAAECFKLAKGIPEGSNFITECCITCLDDNGKFCGVTLKLTGDPNLSSSWTIESVLY